MYDYDRHQDRDDRRRDRRGRRDRRDMDRDRDRDHDDMNNGMASRFQSLDEIIGQASLSIVSLQNKLPKKPNNFHGAESQRMGQSM